MEQYCYFPFSSIAYFQSSTRKKSPLCCIFWIIKLFFFGEFSSCRLCVLIQSLPQTNTLLYNYKYQTGHDVSENNFFNEKHSKHSKHSKQWTHCMTKQRSVAVPGCRRLWFPFFMVIHFNNIYSTFRDLFRRFGMRLGTLEVSSSHSPAFAQTTPSSAKFHVSLSEVYFSWFIKLDSSQNFQSIYFPNVCSILKINPYACNAFRDCFAWY
jgi:hypothetical protein